MKEAKQPTDGPAPWHFEAGRTIDHYRVLRPVDRGGMAEVYLARDTRLGRRVALEYLEGSTLRELLAQESSSPREAIRISLAIAQARSVRAGS